MMICKRLIRENLFSLSTRYFFEKSLRN